MKQAISIFFIILISLTLAAADSIAQTPTPIPQTIDEKQILADKTYAEGLELFKQGTVESYKSVLAKFQTAADLFGQTNNQEQLGSALLGIGTISLKLGDRNAALKNYNEALAIFRRINKKDFEVVTLNNIALIYSESGRKQEALECYIESLSVYRLINDKKGESIALKKIGDAYADLGNYQKAIEYYDQSLSLSRAIEYKAGEASTLNSLGVIHEFLGEKQKSLEYYNQSLQIDRSVGNKENEAITLSNMAKIYASLGDNPKSLEIFNQSLLIARMIGDKIQEAFVIGNIAAIYANLGERQKALEYFNQSIALARAGQYKTQEAGALEGIGAIYFAFADNQKALEYFDQSLAIRREIGDKSGEASIYGRLGAIYTALKDNQKALEYFNRSLALRREFGDKTKEASILNNIGIIYSNLKENRKALEYYNQSLQILRATGDKPTEAVVLGNIGNIYLLLGENEKALEFFQMSLPVSRYVGYKSDEANMLGLLSIYWYYQKNPQLAIFYDKQAINLYQQLRSNIIGAEKENQKSYLKSIEFNYRFLANMLIEQGRFAEARQVLDLFKDQQFFDFNRNPNEPVKQLVQTPREVEMTARYLQASEQYNKTNFEFDTLKRKIGNRQPNAEEAAQMQKAESTTKTAGDNLSALFKKIADEFSKPADAKDKAVNIPDTLEMQKTLRLLNQQTNQKSVAVYTLVSDKSFHAIIISPDEIKAITTPVKGTELNEKALKLWGILQSDNYDTTILSKQIYDTIFKPLEAALPKDTTTIMWSLDGNLRYIPPAALWDGNRFLAERFSHVNFTRADTERMTRNIKPNWTGTGFGTTNAQTVDLLGDKINFSALPGVDEELKEIFKQTNSKTGVMSGEVLPDAEFTKANFLKSLKMRRPVVHIASHFAFRPGDESRSFLLLGDGSALTLSEMKKETNLFEAVDLLTLSACNTAAAQADATGREIDGFAELAQRLGAGAVMATLWSVSDASTPWLMRDFYATKQSQNNMTKAEALRKAQMALINGTAQTKPLPANEKGAASDKIKIVVSPEEKRDSQNATRSDLMYVSEADAPPYKKDSTKPFAHPYYWSPFVLIGNWK